MSVITEIRNLLEQKKGKRNMLENNISTLSTKIKETGKDLRRHEQAREIIREVGLRTQQQLQIHISNITSMALEAVFPNPYELKVEFVQRRNKTECDLLFNRDGQDIDPLSASGGGAVDIASFALRVASWAMQNLRSRNTLILDEPFRYLSTDLLPRANEMLKEISKKLNLQIIMVSHAEELIEGADKVFTVTMRKGISKV